MSSHREECMERVEENTKFSTDHLIKYQHRNPVQTVYVFCVNLQQPEAGLQLDPVQNLRISVINNDVWEEIKINVTERDI